MEREFQIHFKPNRFHTIGQTEDRFGGGIPPFNQCFPSCQNTEGCRLQWNLTWNTQNEKVLDDLNVYQVAWGFKRDQKIGKLGWSSPDTTKDTKGNAQTTSTSLFGTQASCLKKMPQINWNKTGWHHVWFSLWTLHYGSKFHSPANFQQKILDVCQGCLCTICWPWKAFAQFLCKTLWRVLQE